MTIAVDFDGTCVKHKYPLVGEDVDGAVSVLKELVRKGHKIILYTMRNGDTLDDTLKPHEDDFVRRCVKAHNSAVDELRSLGKLLPQDDIKYSIEYKDSIVPLQESIYEDAKDLEKKKTVDEGTTVVTYKKVYKFVRT